MSDVNINISTAADDTGINELEQSLEGLEAAAQATTENTGRAAEHTESVFARMINRVKSFLGFSGKTMKLNADISMSEIEKKAAAGVSVKLKPDESAIRVKDPKKAFAIAEAAEGAVRRSKGLLQSLAEIQEAHIKTGGGGAREEIEQAAAAVDNLRSELQNIDPANIGEIEKKTKAVSAALQRLSKEDLLKISGDFNNLTQSVQGLSNTAQEAGGKMRLEFSKTEMITSLMEGNLRGVGVQLLALLSRIKLLGGAIGKIPGLIILTGIVTIFQKIKELYDQARENFRQISQQRITGLADSFENAARMADRYNAALERGNRTARESLELARAKRNLESEITKSSIERNRRMALTGAFNEREEYEVNRRFDAEQRAAERRERRANLADDEKTARLDAEKLRRELENERKTLAKQQEIQGQLGRYQNEGTNAFSKDTYINRVKEYYGWSDISVEDLEKMTELDKRFGEAIKERNERIKDLEAQWGIIQESLTNFKTRAEQIDAEEAAETASVSLAEEMERRRRRRVAIEERNRKEDQAVSEKEEEHAAQRRESERGAGYETMLANADELIKRRIDEFESARAKYEGVLREIGERGDDEITPELKAERDRRYDKFRQTQERKREALAARADLELNQSGVEMRDQNEIFDREEAKSDAEREEKRQRAQAVFGEAAERTLARENVAFNENRLRERQAEYQSLNDELARKYGKGFSISDLGSLDRERLTRARGRVWESEDNLRQARFEKDRVEYSHMIEADKNFRDISTRQNRLTAMGLAGGGFSWGESMSKDTRKLVALTERMLQAMNSGKAERGGVAWSIR